MDVSHVQQRVQAIAEASGDPEAAHSLEDDLFVDVLKTINAESTDPRAQALAGAVLTSREINFERWYA
ncbi:hypothetical protein ABT010_13430 [Streptomyces sp. NPDC002668]|uniref:hypothetical protein n=1 Tax=Streptomyces sp. NPDC002668 TaxID=3154422 RepID=UPI003328AAF6